MMMSMLSVCANEKSHSVGLIDINVGGLDFVNGSEYLN